MKALELVRARLAAREMARDGRRLGRVARHESIEPTGLHRCKFERFERLVVIHRSCLILVQWSGPANVAGAM